MTDLHHGCAPALRTVLKDCLRALDERRHRDARRLAGQARDLAVNIGVLPYAEAMALCGVVERQAGDRRSAEAALGTALDLSGRQLDTVGGAPLHLCAAAELAGLRRTGGRLREAERVLVAALAMTAHVDRPPEALGSLYLELGAVHTRGGRLDRATECHGLAWRLLAGSLPEDDVLLATLHRHRSTLALAHGDHLAAERAGRRALGIRVQALGAAHPDVAGDCAALAVTLLGSGQLEEAECLLRRALTAFAAAEGSAGLDHPVTLGNLAAVVHRRGHHLAADTLYRRALAALSRGRGEGHPDLTPVLADRARLRRDLDARPGGPASRGLPSGNPHLAAGSCADALRSLLPSGRAVPSGRRQGPDAGSTRVTRQVTRVDAGTG